MLVIRYGESFKKASNVADIFRERDLQSRSSPQSHREDTLSSLFTSAPHTPYESTIFFYTETITAMLARQFNFSTSQKNIRADIVASKLIGPHYAGIFAIAPYIYIIPQNPPIQSLNP